ncbi:RTA1 domain-containing protein, partial [Aspergillus fijiensis CBS 313.89]
MTQCKALTTPDTMWTFCPSIGAAYLFTVLFALTTLAHLAQTILHRKFYSWVIVMSGLIQTVTYIFRILSILNPASYTDYAAWFVLILIAPLWTNAFVYMVMGRMVWNFTDDARVLRVRPWHFGLFFVALDIIAFIVQVYGAAQAAGNNVSYSTEMMGLHIYMAGVGVQQLFVLVFVVCGVAFHRKLLQQRRSDAKKALLLLYVLYTCLALITMRIIFRLCEYAQGLDSEIPAHEAYQYCLDSLPMLLALVLLNVVHPGRIMPGKESNMPSRKQRKKMGVTSKKEMPSDDMVRLGEC